MGRHPQKTTVWRKAGGGMAPDGSVSWVRVGVFNTRWEDHQKLIQSGYDRIINSRSAVYSPESFFEIGDMIAEGDFPNQSPVKNSFEVKDTMRIPNLSGTQFEYKAIV